MNENAKICPLLSIGKMLPVPCLRADCAWWDATACRCCLASGADCIREISDELELKHNLSVE